MSWINIAEACRVACFNVGIEYKQFPNDDNFHPVDAIDGKKGNKAGRIKNFSDCKGGIAFNFKTDSQQAFFANKNPGEPIAPADLERIKSEQRRREAEQLKKQDQAAIRALDIWHSSEPAPQNHPYFVQKQIQVHRARVAKWRRSVINEEGQKQTLVIDDALILPMFNSSGTLRSIQAIFPEENKIIGRSKDFLPGSSVAGLFWWIGEQTTKKVIICEGFATAATLHEETNWRTYIAFSAGNLMAVGKIVREKMPNAVIVFAADNDVNTKGNPGLTKATAAALAVGGYVAVPTLAGDFNDYALFLKGACHVG